MKTGHSIKLLVLFLGLTMVAVATAGVPQTINYQGYLKNGDGTPVSTNTSMTFSLYTTSNGAGAVWGSGAVSVTPANGVYSVELGANPQPALPAFDRPYWLGVRAGGDPEMRPLQALSSVPYALRTLLADTVANNSIGTSAVADGSITTSKIADGAVTDIKITGPISGSKIPDLAGLQASIAALQTTVAAQQTAIGQLTTTSSQQQTTINDLQIQISHLNTPPSVSGGYDLHTAPGTMVILYGKLSDPDSYQSLTWSWSIVSRPGGSTALLSSTSDAVTLFTPDVIGTYQFMLTASDGVTTVTASATLSVTAGMLGQAQLIETDTGDSASPQVAMDGSGNAVAVWSQSDGTRSNIWANRYVKESGWGTAVLIETDKMDSAEFPQVAMDSSGNAVAVWQQYDGLRYNIWTNRYTPAAGWGTALLIENDDTGSAVSLQVAMDSSGNAVAVWQQSDGIRDNIWANRYVNGTGWGTAQLIETDNAASANSPQVAMDSSGNAVAVWQQFDGIRDNIWANRYVNGTGWGTALLIETDTGSAGSPQVAMDSSGNAVAVWFQSDDARYNIWANRFTPGGGWETAILIEAGSSSAAYPQVAMDSSGNAVAVWHQFDITGVNIWANRYVKGIGWGTAQLIETDNSGSATSPQVAMDSSGNAVAVWHQFDGTRNNIWANRYVNGTGWRTALLIETDTGDAGSPQVVMDSSGYAVAVWQQHDGTRNNIWANLISVGWRQAQLIETDNTGSAESPQVAMDNSGNAVAVWLQFDGARNNIWANRYVMGTGWGTAQLIETDTGDAYSPQVAMDSSGNAVAVWQQYDGTGNNIRANRYVNGTGWGTAQLIETDTGDAYSPQVAMDSSGNSVAVWRQSDGTTYNIWTNRYTSTAGWGMAQLIENNDTGLAAYPQVAMNSSGNAVAVWQQYNGTRDSIWANRYVNGSWGTAQLIDSDNTEWGSSPQVAMDSSGNAVAVWMQSAITGYNIWANRYVNGSWVTAQLIETDTGSAGSPQVVMDGSGNAVAVWSQSDGARYNIWANQYSPFSGWVTARLIETDNVGDAGAAQLSMNSSGNAVAVWSQSDGTRDNIWANRFTPGVGWDTALLIESDNAGSAQIPQVAIDPAGNPIAVWHQSDGTRNNIWANRPWK